MSTTRLFSNRSSTAGLGSLTRRNLRQLPAAAGACGSALWHIEQRAHYAIPVQDKKNDDLGGPYGQEPPSDSQRKKTNRGIAGQAAIVVALGTGLATIFAVFANPRAIARHQIENDKVIGSPGSTMGQSLAELKHKEGVMTTHDLHREQAVGGQSLLGKK